MEKIYHDNLTVVYITANYAPEVFLRNTQHYLIEAIGDTPLISVSKKPMIFGRNICVGQTPRSHLNIYRQALIGAKEADTDYIAIAEDDVLYTPEHFKYRPKSAPFAYNLGTWSLYTWVEPAIFTYKGGGRINLNGLICERKAFIEAIEERFNKYPDDSKVEIRNWAEPGKYESHLGVTVREKETFYINPPNIMFSHENALQYETLGRRKRLGEMRATVIPHWGKAETIVRLYS